MARWWRILAICVVAARAWSQEAPNRRVPAVTRADLAVAFQRFEQALNDHPPTPERFTELNKGFDGLTRIFFSGNLGLAIEQLNALTDQVRPKSTEEQSVLDSLRLRVLPRVIVNGQSRPPTISVAPIYRLKTDLDRIELSIRLLGPGGKEVAALTAPVALKSADAQAVPIPVDVSKLPMGKLTLEVSTKGTPYAVVDQCYVVDRSLDEAREENEAKLARLEGKVASLEQSLATARARNRLLTDNPSEAKTISILTDLTALKSEVAGEIATLESGKDPYQKRKGDYWRVVKIGAVEAPARVYVPPTLSLDGPAPLVVALHGAGGDENMFMEAYGAGMIKRLADKKGFIVVSPVTALMGNATYFDKLIDAIGAEYPIDRSRLYVVGHSMGAGVAEMLARTRPNSLAAVCCLAGGGRAQPRPNDKIPPTLILGAELDPLIPAARLEPAAKAAQSAGLPVEYRTILGQGHTLMVTTQLPGAIDWLLKHRLERSPGGG